MLLGDLHRSRADSAPPARDEAGGPRASIGFATGSPASPQGRLAALLLAEPGALVSERRLSLAAGPSTDLDDQLTRLTGALGHRGWELVRLDGGAVVLVAPTFREQST